MNKVTVVPRFFRLGVIIRRVTMGQSQVQLERFFPPPSLQDTPTVLLNAVRPPGFGCDWFRTLRHGTEVIVRGRLARTLVPPPGAAPPYSQSSQSPTAALWQFLRDERTPNGLIILTFDDHPPEYTSNTTPSKPKCNLHIVESVHIQPGQLRFNTPGTSRQLVGKPSG